MDYKTALQCAVLSKEVYQSFSKVKFQAWPNVKPVLINQANTDTQLTILEDSANSLGVIVFRGSDADQDWNINMQTGQTEQEWSREEKKKYRAQIDEAVVEEKDLIYPDAYGEPSRPVKMHRGFVTAYLSVRDEIHDHIRNSGAKLYRVTGHSLGGALATLCAVDLQYNFGSRMAVEAYTFGSPRVGNDAFAESYNVRVPNSWRVVNGWDAVVGLPAPWRGYRHVDTDIKLERGFTWRIITGSIEDHRMDNYIEALQEKV
jgi:triacylglycerol lipase